MILRDYKIAPDTSRGTSPYTDDVICPLANTYTVLVVGPAVKGEKPQAYAATQVGVENVDTPSFTAKRTSRVLFSRQPNGSWDASYEQGNAAVPTITNSRSDPTHFNTLLSDAMADVEIASGIYSDLAPVEAFM